MRDPLAESGEGWAKIFKNKRRLAEATDNEIGYEHSGHVGKTVTHYLRLKNSKVVVALAYSYDDHFDERPNHTAHKLAKMVLRASK